ncbi:radical SAM family heme chaperone HemW [Rhodocyclus gracilis]|uniref:Heme chaperone HemW n=1 Tax=Rhodocyclus tenuis TaxID=1066 RepID=A0A6L5JWD7_RHOTE|nr:radical SAM family heme chaperone HemW [Rhodocyclus gracilis]MQY51386.1 oxygen-independent coproporphyrinogen III oxidase-like protein [Rhodocyclus gracilis]
MAASRQIPAPDVRSTAGGTTPLPPLSLYVHFPWCIKKCPYCDFNSHGVREAIPEAAYVAALIADFTAAAPALAGRPIRSVFFGGGTPSLMSGEAVHRLLDELRQQGALADDAEITLEANPGAVEAARFRAYREAGVNRLSLGIQSFSAAQLQALGRVHKQDEARRAIELAARHFANFNLDLMYALPGQRVDEALADLETALTFAPPHLSCYQLTLEPHTAFAAAPPVLPDDDTAAAMQEGIEARLAAAGFTHYETSAFARPGRQCRHNLNYWHYGDYLGIGAGAHSKLSSLDDAGQLRVLRQVRWAQPARYLSELAPVDARASTGGSADAPTPRQPLAEEFTVAAAERPFEFMMNALRLNEGFAESLFAERCALPLAQIEEALRRAEREGLLERSGGRIAPSARGRRFLNRLLEGFLSDD